MKRTEITQQTIEAALDRIAAREEAVKECIAALEEITRTVPCVIGSACDCLLCKGRAALDKLKGTP